MKSPGVELRPIRTLDGDQEVNEVFFTDVKVPGGKPGGRGKQGLDVRQVPADLRTHGHRRRGLLHCRAGKAPGDCRQGHENGKPLDQDPLFAARMAQVEIDLENMKTTNLRVIAAVAGGGVPGAESSMLKIAGTEIRQEILSLMRRAVGPYALPFIEEAQYEGYAGRTRGPEEAADCRRQLLQLPQAVDLRRLQ